MKKLNIIIPQYQSNYCVNNCQYCGFKASNTAIPRKRLSFDEFKNEFETILAWGYRTIEFVYASDPILKPIDIVKRIEYAKDLSIKKNYNLRIGLNADPLSYQDYKLLKDAGLDFFVLWMETYSPEKYTFWHGNNNQKSNLDYRISSYNRAIEAGLTNYGMGVLLGLNDWKDDVNNLISHGKKLIAQYGISPYIIGLPRYKKAHSVVLNGEISKINDEDFKRICSIYKQEFPDAMLFFNTRECLDLNIDCCSNGDLFTIDCGTYPGAFINPDTIQHGYEQFHTQPYNREFTLYKLKEKKIVPKYEW